MLARPLGVEVFTRVIATFAALIAAAAFAAPVSAGPSLSTGRDLSAEKYARVNYMYFPSLNEWYDDPSILDEVWIWNLKEQTHQSGQVASPLALDGKTTPTHVRVTMPQA